jgi:translation initiation factor 3 subunit K
VDALLANPSSFGASLAPPLEAYVQAEASGTVPYHLEVNRTLLKLYQFFPQQLGAADGNSGDVIALILLLALLEYPNADLLVVSSLVPERTQQQNSLCATVLQCADLLDACQFAEFWTAFSTLSQQQQQLSQTAPQSDVIKAFDNILKTTATKRLQSAILQVLASTYRSAPLALVQSALGGAAASADLAKTFTPPIETVQGDLVTFVPTADNTKRNRVFKEEVDLSAISKMMILSRE